MLFIKQRAENKTTKKIYINASKVSHFTNFNRFTKENEFENFYEPHIYGYVNFFILHIKIHFRKIINNGGDLEISSIKKGSLWFYTDSTRNFI